MRTGLVTVGVAAAMLVAAVPATGTSAAPSADIGASLATHLDAVDAAEPVRVFVVGDDLDVVTAAVRTAGLAPGLSLDEVDMVTATGTRAQVEALATEPGVRGIHWADEPIAYHLETSHDATRARGAHDGAFDADGDGHGDVLDGSGVSIAVVDSGIDGTHPAFADEHGGSRVARNVKIVCSDAVGILAGDFETVTPACAVDATAVNDTDTISAGGHGTHVAGIAGGGRVTDAAGRDLSGAAPNATLIGVSTGASLSVYGGTLGMYWALQNAADPCGDGSCPAIKVLNNSWGPAGGGSFSPTAPQVVVQRALVEAGVTVVWAAGNDGGDGTAAATNPYSTDPTPGVLSVANYSDADAGTREGDLNATSSRGARGIVSTYPDLSAPGTAITAACRPYLTVCATGLDTADPDYNTISGTSMAAPHVAGYVAVLQQASRARQGRDLTPGEVEDLLVDTAHPFGPGDRYVDEDTRNPDAATLTSFDAGHGLVDVHAALETLLETTVEAGDGPACPVDAAFTDAAGDATAVLGTSTPLPNEPALDIVAGRASSDADTGDVALHWQVADLPDSPGGTSGNGEYFDVNFSYDGAGFYVTASRTATDGERFVLGRFETTRTTIAEISGSFDPATDEITAVLPADVFAANGVGSTIEAGDTLSGFELVSRREVVVIVPDADTAKGTCPYVVGAEHADPEPPANTAPAITDVTATPTTAAAGEEITFAVEATDADGDALTVTWDFGDGTSGEGAPAVHAYDAAGTYTATVTVSDGTDVATDTVVVEVTEPEPEPTDCEQLEGRERAQCRKEQRDRGNQGGKGDGGGNGNAGGDGGKATLGKRAP